MPEAVLNIVKSTVDVTGLSDNDFTAHLNTNDDAMLDNPSCFNPSADMADFKAAAGAFATAAAQEGKAAILERDKRGAAAADMLRLLPNVLLEGNPSVNTNVTSSPRQQPSRTLSVPPLVCSS